MKNIYVGKYYIQKAHRNNSIIDDIWIFKVKNKFLDRIIDCYHSRPTVLLELDPIYVLQGELDPFCEISCQVFHSFTSKIYELSFIKNSIREIDESELYPIFQYGHGNWVDPEIYNRYQKLF